MSVWLVLEMYDTWYQITYIEKIFDSEEKAIEYIKIKQFSKDTYIITKMEVE